MDLKKKKKLDFNQKVKVKVSTQQQSSGLHEIPRLIAQGPRRPDPAGCGSPAQRAAPEARPRPEKSADLGVDPNDDGWEILWTKSNSHQFETMVETIVCWYLSFHGLLGGAGFRPPTVSSCSLTWNLTEGCWKTIFQKGPSASTFMDRRVASFGLVSLLVIHRKGPLINPCSENARLCPKKTNHLFLASKTPFALRPGLRQGPKFV